MASDLVLYFDYISPYAYVGFHVARALAERRGLVFRPEPVLFAAILNTLGQKGPAEIPPKREYTFKDAYRKAHAAGLPRLVPPPSHPFNPLLALRATGLVDDLARRADAIAELCRATWALGEGVEDARSVAVAFGRAGLDGEELVRRANDPAAKERLRATTDRAIAEGAFGVPTVIANDELFFGVDGLAFVEAHLDGHDPVPKDAYARWASLPASAQRVR